jgi:glycosyltransferase involved in cell wall biosynthesis
MDKWNLKNASCSVVIGPKIREYLMRTRKVQGGNIKVVYNWQDESRFQTTPEQTNIPNSDIFTFMYVGSISRAAGLQCVIDAFVAANISNAKLVFAGSGTEKENLIAESIKYNNVLIEFIEAPFEKIAAIQAQADVLILPLLKGVSLRAVPSKLPAYLFSHKAVIACVEEDSDVADIIIRGDCGWVSPPENVESLADLMTKVSTYSKNELQHMGENGYEFSQVHLTKKANLEKLINIITN